MKSKEFFLHELENIEQTLKETLRHDYPPGSGREFYDECMGRLRRLRSRIETTDPTNYDDITYNSSSLSNASHLISLIERSHLGEFSWSFADRLRCIAAPLCAESGPLGNLEPIIHILADGGLTAYRIYPESHEPDLIRHRRILNIVFPRTLKHHVLLHAIFGHEIGHAAWAIPQLRSKLNADVVSPLFRGSVLEDETKADVWLASGPQPKEFTYFLALWDSKMPHKFGFSGKNNKTLYRWQQEFFCDLFGIIMFGPSFAGAHKLLLGTTQQRGERFSDTHPPYASRAILISRALKLLGWFPKLASDVTISPSPLDTAISTFSKFVIDVPSNDPFYDVFSDTQIGTAIDGLKNLLEKFPNALYTAPAESDILSLVDSLVKRVPPCGAKLGFDGDPELSAIDFRHVLYAGWIVRLGREHLTGAEALDFLLLNRLCDRGILHQNAVAEMMKAAGAVT